MRTHFIGIGGIGMSGIARLLLARGEQVSGSDMTDHPILQGLRRQGARVSIGHRAGQVHGADCVIYSSSIAPDNPELSAARNRRIPVLHRGQAIGRLLRGKRTIAVAGSHGKSTTTALIASVLLDAGLDPTVILGAELELLGGNARPGAGRWAVVETDESDGSFLWLEPEVAVITNMDDEHLDYFRNRTEIRAAYGRFADRVRPGGLLIGCADDPAVGRILAGSNRRRIAYGLSSEAELAAGRLELKPGGSRFLCLRRGRPAGWVRLRIPGRHNALNGLAAVACAEALGIAFPAVAASLEGYSGAGRRFQIQGQIGGVMVVEDYAHHPTEIRATLEAARSWPARRIRCVFQPHRYSRTRFLLDRFGSCFDSADELILLPIYAASEEPIAGVTSAALLEAVRRLGKVPVSCRSAEETLEALASDSRPGDLILFLGAGSVGALARRFLENLREAAHAEPLRA